MGGEGAALGPCRTIPPATPTIHANGGSAFSFWIRDVFAPCIQHLRVLAPEGAGMQKTSQLKDFRRHFEKGEACYDVV